MHAYEEQELKSYIDALKNTFDAVRIVNPVENSIVIADGIDDLPVDIKCYDFWKKEKLCKNCTSLHCMKTGRTTTKIEYKEDNAVLVISTPIEVHQNKYVIEMLLNMNDVDTINDISKENDMQKERIITNLEDNLLIDDLTGIYNRRFINKTLPSIIEDGKDKGIEMLAVIMVDIDNFKYINDTYGHVAGDKALQKVAAIINSRIRKGSDWVARYGGDEFVILLKNANETVANKVIESIQKKIENCNFTNPESEVEITLSFGIYVIEPGTTNYEDVLETIDYNLNEAKCSGKNKAIISHNE